MLVLVQFQVKMLSIFDKTAKMNIDNLQESWVLQNLCINCIANLQKNQLTTYKPINAYSDKEPVWSYVTYQLLITNLSYVAKMTFTL